MAWVTISLRKQALKARMNYLNNRLMDISQERESMQMSAGYAQSAMSAQKDIALMRAQEAYANNLSAFGDTLSNNNLTQSQAMEQFYGLDMSYQVSQMEINSLFQSAEDAQRKMISARETALSSEQETLQSQLAAVSAEYDALDKALEQDIKRDTIKLA